MKTRENKAMRFASVLLVLTLLATSLTAGTFAKYTTDAKGEGKARVAKFGVDVSVDTSKLFGEQYGAENKIVEANDNSITVQVNSTDATADTNVVAPGTSGSMTFEISGNPETSVNLQIGMTGITENTNIKEVMLKAQTYRKDGDDTEITVSDKDYYPVKWTLTKGNSTVTHSTVELKNTTLTKINEYFKSISKEYAPNSLDTVAGKYDLSWAWDFDTTPTAGSNDIADTILGDIAADETIKKLNSSGDYVDLVDGTDYCINEEFKLTISVTQVD